MATSCLVQLAVALKASASCRDHSQLSTAAFTSCCDSILPFFDHLGPVFHAARGEFEAKLTSLKQLTASHPRLCDIVEADRQAKSTTVKNSPTRNLHRLAAAILFVKLLFERLLDQAMAAVQQPQQQQQQQPGATLREAASSAYEAALAPFHTAIVKGIVRAGMLTLPSREHFIEAIGESEESAAARAAEVVDACHAVHASVCRLLEGIEMPASNVWLWPSR